MALKTRVIYEPSGKAREYGDLAVNFYNGDCGHECSYCYVKLHMNQPHGKPKPRDNILKLLDRDARILRHAGDKRPVFLSFLNDPYQQVDEQYQITRQALQILLGYGLNVRILTKGGKRLFRDLDLFKQYKNQVEIGATLVFPDDRESLRYEPHAAPTSERIAVLETLHDGFGIHTWVSLEPVWQPEYAFMLIGMLTVNNVVDIIKVGKMNYTPEAEKIDWRKFAHDVKDLLETTHHPYMLKEDLQKYIEEKERGQT